MSQDNEALQTELDALKVRADRMGLTYHPSIGVEKLKAKIDAALKEEAPKVEEPAEAAPVAAPAQETPGQRRMRMKREAEALVRIRITCMNPAKKEWDGEIFTTGNASVGSLKKFVPFNAPDGWHVPKMIYDMIVERQCQIFVTTTDGRGNKIRKGKLIKEFAVEVLPQLTKAELDELARRQAMSRSVDQEAA